MKMYFMGCAGIENPKGKCGTQIKEGDLLSWDDEDNKKLDWMLKPIFKVHTLECGGLCGRGIDRDLYLHDFRFKHCNVFSN